MRILDKNTDFYDYLQNVYQDNTFTFDRTDSFLLSKELLCQHLIVPRVYRSRKDQTDNNIYNFMLLQICNTFWLFLVDITKIDTETDTAQDYTIELVTKWQNFNAKRVLLQLNVMSFGWHLVGKLVRYGRFWHTNYDRQLVFDNSKLLVNEINNNNYKIENSLNKHVIYNSGKATEKHIPLLKACGIAGCVDALDIFIALEEYFSLEKTSSERTDAIGETNTDKIESHGFDAKSSFRRSKSN